MRMTGKLGAALIGCVAALPALAAFDFTWTFPQNSSSNCLGGTSSACSGQNDFGNVRSSTSDTTTLNAQAWSNTGMPGATSGTSVLATGYLAGWSGGLGVQNRDLTQLGGKSTSDPTFPASVKAGLAGGGDNLEGDNPEHSLDGHDKIDSILLYSTTEFALTGLKFGWTQTDSDIFVLAYTAAGDPRTTMGTLKYSDLQSNGWELVSNYPNVVQGAVTPVNTDAPPVSANYFLIGAYTTAFGTDGCSVNGYNKCDKGNDYLKLFAAYGNKPPDNGVPEPSALLLLGTALVGIWGTRRRKPA